MKEEVWNNLNKHRKRFFFSGVFLTFFLMGDAQNIGIGTNTPTKGKLEIAGALGGYSTVLTIGSDGTGISLQRNWPSIGFNQYRDANNVQRYIGTGYASIIFMNPQDGSIIVSQLGQGTANQEITANTYPLFIDALGSTNLNGALKLKEPIYSDKEVVFTGRARLLGNTSGTLVNLLPNAHGRVLANGTKAGGTSNFTCSYNATLTGYILNTEDLMAQGNLLVTPQASVPCFATYSQLASTVYLIRLWDISGNNVQQNFSFCLYQ